MNPVKALAQRIENRGSVDAAEVGTAWWDSPVKPTPMLVPANIHAARALAKTRRVVASVVALVVVVMLGATTVAFMAAGSAQDRLATAEQARDAKTVELVELADVSQFYDGLDERRTALRNAAGGTIDYPAVIGAILDQMPDGGVVESLDTERGAPCLGPNPYEPTAALGCVTVTGHVQTAADIATFVGALKSDESGLLADAFTPEYTTGVNNTSFMVTVNFTPAAMALATETADEDTTAPEDQPAEEAAPDTETDDKDVQ